MSLNRLRRLAGLNESFTDDPDVNAAIEQRLAKQEPGTQHHWMDVLEIIYDAGRQGISGEEIAQRVAALYPDFGSTLTEMLQAIAHRFDNVVDRQGDRFVWRYPAANDMDIDNEVDAATRAAVGSQVNMASEAIALMRFLTQTHGSFTERNLAQLLTRRSRMPTEMAQQYADHIIGHFQSMLTRVGDGYAMREEEPESREKTMDFLRDLAKNPKGLPEA